MGKQTYSKTRMTITYVFRVLVVLFVCWIVYINLPKPEPAITEVSFSPRVSNSGSIEPEEPQEQLPFRASVVYSPGYLIDIGGIEKLHPFDIRKYEKIHEALKSDGLIRDTDTLNPPEVTQDELLLIHSEAYLQSLQVRTKLVKYLEAGALMFAPVSLDQAVLKPFRYSTGGTIMASRAALQNGIGINIGGGYHHAKPEIGEGFCVYADVPIAIRQLQKENLIKTAVVIDVDAHQGNGTIRCLDQDDSTFTFSMHQGNIYPVPKEVGDRDVELAPGTGDLKYMEIMEEHLEEILDQSKADICFIVGGCDTLSGDPLASLAMTHEGIVKRDARIIEACHKRNLPVVLTLSGGYSPDAWKAQHLSIKHILETYGLAESISESP